MLKVIKLVFSTILVYLRSVNKVICHFFTRYSEIQRIIYGEARGFRRISKFERSLELSKRPLIQDQLRIVKALSENRLIVVKNFRKSALKQLAKDICKEKKINTTLHYKMVPGVQSCLEVILAYKYVSFEIQRMSETKYDETNEEHERKLLEIWKGFKDEDLNDRKSQQWKTLGFQGIDPQTDFRGAGILALESLLYLSTKHKEMGRQILRVMSRSTDGNPNSLPLALVAIHLTMMGKRLFGQGLLKYFFYKFSVLITEFNLGEGEEENGELWREEMVNVYLDFFVSLLADFTHFWHRSTPNSILDFGNLVKVFEKEKVGKLEKMENFHLYTQLSLQC